MQIHAFLSPIILILVFLQFIGFSLYILCDLMLKLLFPALADIPNYTEVCAALMA